MLCPAPKGRTTRKYPLALGALAALGLLCPGQRARADAVSAIGGLTEGSSSAQTQVRNPLPRMGIEYDLRIGPRLNLAGFVDYDRLTYADGGTGALRYMGVLLRYFPRGEAQTGPFVFADAGLADNTMDNQDAHEKLGFGGGLGYQVAFSPVVSLSPRADIRDLPSSPDPQASRVAYFDVGMMLSFRF